MGFVTVGALATFLALPPQPAFAERIVGTNGADVIVGTGQPDQINARKGDDRVNGRRGSDQVKGSRGRDRLKGARGRDHLLGGNGADRLNAVDGQKDRAVNGGPGNDVCTIDKADLSVVKYCNKRVASMKEVELRMLSEQKKMQMITGILQILTFLPF
jgi:Ca2+-binding RTX toxin-like protein